MKFELIYRFSKRGTPDTVKTMAQLLLGLIECVLPIYDAQLR